LIRLCGDGAVSNEAKINGVILHTGKTPLLHTEPGCSDRAVPTITNRDLVSLWFCLCWNLNLNLMAVMIDGPVVIWKLNLLRLIPHDQISLFRALPHICIEYLELSSGFLGYFCLWIIFPALLALWVATRCDFDRVGIRDYPLLGLIHFSFSE
jgi:hypothetical protein